MLVRAPAPRRRTLLAWAAPLLLLATLSGLGACARSPGEVTTTPADDAPGDVSDAPGTTTDAPGGATDTSRERSSSPAPGANALSEDQLGALVDRCQGFGRQLADAGDVDGDGAADLCVEAQGAAAVAYIWTLSGRDGRVLAVQPGALGPQDGPAPPAVRLHVDPDDITRAHAELLHGDDDPVVLAAPGLPGFPQVVIEACALPDLDGDGVGEVALGWPYAQAWGGPLGVVRVYSGATGETLPVGGSQTFHAGGGDPHAAAWPSNDDKPWGFGSALCLVGDVDGDGVSELAVGAPDDGLRRGGVALLSGATREPLWWVNAETLEPARR